MSESTSPPDQNWLDLDEIVELFEDRWHQTGDANVKDFLPPSDHPRFEEITRELLCIDMERRAKTGSSKSVEEYKNEFPDLLSHEAILEGLAFEEYRLLSSQDANLTPTAFAQKYGIRTQHWPIASSDRSSTDAIAHSAWTNGVADEMDRIASVAQLPQVGEPFLDFDLIEELGNCQFSRVFIARQRLLSNRQVVIKISSNLWLESDRLARLQHTHIVPVYSVHEHGGLQAVCMPFLGKQTLRSILATFQQQTGPSPRSLLEVWVSNEHSNPQDQARIRQQELLGRLTHEQFCAWIIAKVAAGLSHAHDRGILHRDLKPANILMTDDLRPMILDFNLSEDAVAGGQSSLVIGGTLPYMAPEHLLAVVDEGEVDKRSDVYALGIMLFQLLTGRMPFQIPPNSTVGALSYLLNDRSELAPTVRTHDPQLSTDIESIVIRCLSANPASRYQTARELQEDLERHLNSLPPKHAPIRSRQEQFSKWVKRHPHLTSSTAIIVVSAVLMALMGYFYIARSGENAQLVAKQAFHQLKEMEKRASGPLSLPFEDALLVATGIQQAKSALALIGADHENWTEHSNYRLLSETEQVESRRLAKRLQYLVAAAYLDKAINSSPAERDKLLQLAVHHNRLAGACKTTHLGRAVRLQQAEIRAAMGQNPDVNPSDLEEMQDDELDISSTLLVARHHLRNNEFGEAETIMQRLNRDRPNEFYGWIVMGNCAYRLNRLRQADTCFTSAIALWPESHTAHLLRGICRMQTDDFDAAEEDLTRAIALDRENPAALVNRAIVRIKQHNYQDAVSDLTRSIEVGRDDSLVFILRAHAHAGLGNTELAKLDFETGKQKTPICVLGWIHRGLAYRTSSPENALHDFDSALRLDPRSKQALRNKVALLSQLNRNQEALDAISMLVTLSPNDAQALLGRGLLRSRLGDRKAALADCRLAIEIEQTAMNHYQAARIFANTSEKSPSDADQAAFHLKKSLQDAPRLLSQISRDPDLQPVLAQPRIKSLLSATAALIHSDD